MGRQLPIYATPGDEVELLRFIQTLSPIRIFGAFTRDRESLWIDDWERRAIDNFQFSVWLQEFDWVPKYQQTGGPHCPADRAGLYYVSNSGTAPVLEISRPPTGSISGGRIYWGKDFSATRGLDYDAVAFSKRVDQIWRWIRRNGRCQPETHSTSGPYILPQAFAERFGEPP